MKKHTFKIVFTLIFLCLILVSCGGKVNPPVEKPPENPPKPTPDLKLEDFFYTGEEPVYYHGSAEFGYEEEYQGDSSEEDKIIKNYSGYMIDGEGDDPEDRKFTKTVTLSGKPGIREVSVSYQKNKLFGRFQSATLFNTIIENKIVLKEPVIKGTNWTQNFVYAGKTHTCKSIITKVQPDSVTVLTTVDPIDDFFGQTYEEEMTFTVGKGLTSYGGLYPLSYFSSSDGMTEEDYHFSYSRVEK